VLLIARHPVDLSSASSQAGHLATISRNSGNSTPIRAPNSNSWEDISCGHQPESPAKKANVIRIEGGEWHVTANL
jgi:hypothetical protein